jgi:hypothetical protein
MIMTSTSSELLPVASCGCGMQPAAKTPSPNRERNRLEQFLALAAKTQESKKKPPAATYANLS